MHKRMSRKNVDSYVLEQMYAAIGGSDAFCKYFSSKKKNAADDDTTMKKKKMAEAILEHLFRVDGGKRKSCYLTYVKMMEDAEHFNDACGPTPAELLLLLPPSPLEGGSAAKNNFKMKKWPLVAEKTKKEGDEVVKKLIKVMKWKELGVLLLSPHHDEDWEMHVLTLAVLAKRILVQHESSGTSSSSSHAAGAMKVLELCKQWLLLASASR
jgi:hypothetical protein